MKPIIVGITGGIGGGKSTLAELLFAHGYLVYSSDSEARRLQNEHPVILQKLKELFGEQIYVENALDRPALAKIVFGNKDLLAQLNAIVHPVLRADLNDWIEANNEEKLLFIESAIMMESGLVGITDKVIVMTASQEIRIGRVIKRDHVTREQVLSRMASQMPEDEKIIRADYIIHSDDNQPLLPKMKRIVEELEKMTPNP